jgi:hypothetical protein
MPMRPLSAASSASSLAAQSPARPTATDKPGGAGSERLQLTVAASEPASAPSQPRRDSPSPSPSPQAVEVEELQLMSDFDDDF